MDDFIFRRGYSDAKDDSEEKQRARERIERDTRIFEMLGGKIQHVARGVSGEDTPEQRKRKYNTVKTENFNGGKLNPKSVSNGGKAGNAARTLKARLEKEKRPYQYAD